MRILFSWGIIKNKGDRILIGNADGLIIGTSNYLGDVTAGFRALYERLISQSLTYKTEVEKQRHETVFPEDKKKALTLGAEMVNNSW